MGGEEIDQNAGLTNGRRSVYFRSTKEKKMTFLSLFDSPNVVECYRRSESIVPQQALALANGALTLNMARDLAAQMSPAVVASAPSPQTRTFGQASRTCTQTSRCASGPKDMSRASLGFA